MDLILCLGGRKAESLDFEIFGVFRKNKENE